MALVVICRHTVTPRPPTISHS